MRPNLLRVVIPIAVVALALASTALAGTTRHTAATQVTVTFTDSTFRLSTVNLQSGRYHVRRRQQGQEASRLFDQRPGRERDAYSNARGRQEREAHRSAAGRRVRALRSGRPRRVQRAVPRRASKRSSHRHRRHQRRGATGHAASDVRGESYSRELGRVEALLEPDRTVDHVQRWAARPSTITFSMNSKRSFSSGETRVSGPAARRGSGSGRAAATRGSGGTRRRSEDLVEPDSVLLEQAVLERCGPTSRPMRSPAYATT